MGQMSNLLVSTVLIDALAFFLWRNDIQYEFCKNLETCDKLAASN